MNSKLKLLEERKKKFYDDKNIDTIKQEIEAEVFSNRRQHIDDRVVNQQRKGSDSNESHQSKQYNSNRISSGSNSSSINRCQTSHSPKHNDMKTGHNHINGSYVDDKEYMISKNNDLFLNRLTEKLTRHIRNEMNNQFMNEGIIGDPHHDDGRPYGDTTNGGKQADNIRNLMSQHMDLFLESELSTHTCKICFELMLSPIHTPILLFPCGHTFCKSCMDKHISSTSSISHDHNISSNNNYNNNSSHNQSNRTLSTTTTNYSSIATTTTTSTSSTNQNHINRININKKGCPYCRTTIESQAINQSLKELIEQFSKQKVMIMDTSIRSMEEIFQSSVIHHNHSQQQKHYNHHEMNRYNNHSNINDSRGQTKSDSER